MENIAILGFGISGYSAYQALKDKYNIYVQDDNIEEIKSKNPDLKIKTIKSIDQLKDIDPIFVVKSPGIKPENKYVKACKENSYDLMSDLELAYRLFPNRTIIAITGTNGKTTTTSLVGEIIKNAGKTVHVIGNIGSGILEAFAKGSEEDVYLIEVSSFQLEDTSTFRPNIGAFLNFSPDHLDWHGSIENYFAAKCKIFGNMIDSDIFIVNKDTNLPEKINSKEYVLFSKSNSADYYIKNDEICGPNGKILSKESIKLPGAHNLENILAAVSITSEFGIDKDIIENTIKNFLGVEHRIEFVRELNKVKYYNDSKGTNVDSTIKALEAFESPLVVIAGGYDKKVNFTELMDVGKSRVKSFVLLGQTKDLLKEQAENAGIKCYLVETMKEAVSKSYELAEDSDIVLLSPACASWGMYDNFEERGKDFKNLVNELEC